MCITSKVVKESKVKREVMEHGDSREYHRNDRDGRGYRQNIEEDMIEWIVSEIVLIE